MTPDASTPVVGAGTTEFLASFLPRERLARLTAPVAPERPRAERLDGAVLFVDVSGFTHLTERLGRQGAVGSERLSQVIDTCFGRLTDRVTELGGDVIAFAGDAMLAMWPATPRHELRAATRLAAQAALRAQNDPAMMAEAGSERLRLRASVACGSLYLLEVGGHEGRWEYLVGGTPLTEVREADGRARPGEVVAAPSASRLLGPAAAGSPLGDGFLVLHGIPHPLDAPAVERSAIAVPADRLALLRRCVPDFIVSRLEAGQADWLAEFRRVSVVFIGLGDVELGRGPAEVGQVASASSLQGGFEVIQRAVGRARGSVYQALVDDKGVSVIAAFGLPAQGREDDAARAVRCALDARSRLLEIGLASSTGVTTGLAFTGIYGTSSRRQYTLVGSVMNRGARLAQAAEGGILCDEATRASATRSGSSFSAGPALRLKGIEEPVAVWRPDAASSWSRGPATAEAPAHSVVGRDEERAVLDTALQALASRSDGGLVLIEGEAGIGKSRLVSYAAVQAGAADVRRLAGYGEQIERLSLFHPWRPVFEELLGLDAEDPDPAGIAAALDERFAGDPDLRELVPLLGSVLPVNIPDVERTAAMPAEARAEATRDLLVRLLREAAEAEPTLLVLEDVHWFDSASLALLVATVERIPTLLVVASTRPPDGDAAPLVEALARAPGARRVELGALQEGESAALIRSCLGVDELAGDVTTMIHRRAQGNPFFTVQIALALRDYGLLTVAGGSCRASSDATDLNRSLDEQLSRRGLPATLQGVVGSRIDRLDPEPQLAVKLASVIGPRFETETLASIAPGGMKRPELTSWLDDLVGLGILVPDDSEPEPAFLFRHMILRDVVYNSLTFGQRRTTHTSVAEWLERDGGRAEVREYPILAHHWTHAGVPGRAIPYLAGAGEDALERYSNREAVRFFEDAIALDETAEDRVPDRMRAAWELQLGHAYVNWSRYGDAREHLGTGLALSGYRAPGTPVADGVGLATEMLRQAAHRAWSGRFVGRRGNAGSELRQMARAYECLVEAFYLDNATLPCLLSAVRSLNLAELGGPSAELARGYASFGAILGFVPAHRIADSYFRRALDTARASDDAAAGAWVGLAAGVYLIGVGAWEEAAQHLTETREVSERLGDRRRWDDATQNLGAISFLRGRYERSLVEASELLASATDRKDERALSVALRRRALCLLATNDLAELESCIAELESYGLGTGDLYRDLPALALRAQLHFREGRPRDALEAAEAAISIMRGTTPTFYDALSDFVNVAEVLLSLHRLSLHGELAEVPDLQPLSRDACKALRRLGRVFPIARPYALLWNGVRLQAEGRSRRAHASWRECLDTASDLGLERCEARARLELGRDAPHV